MNLYKAANYVASPARTFHFHLDRLREREIIDQRDIATTSSISGAVKKVSCTLQSLIFANCWLGVEEGGRDLEPFPPHTKIYHWQGTRGKGSMQRQTLIVPWKLVMLSCATRTNSALEPSPEKSTIPLPTYSGTATTPTPARGEKDCVEVYSKEFTFELWAEKRPYIPFGFWSSPIPLAVIAGWALFVKKGMWGLNGRNLLICRYLFMHLLIYLSLFHIIYPI